jgi:hypothetical protein
MQHHNVQTSKTRLFISWAGILFFESFQNTTPTREEGMEEVVLLSFPSLVCGEEEKIHCSTIAAIALSCLTPKGRGIHILDDE